MSLNHSGKKIQSVIDSKDHEIFIVFLDTVL